MKDPVRLFQAFVAPSIFVSATALLILSINVRLMGIVSRLRQYVHERYAAETNGRTREVEAYTAQIHNMERRGRKVRNAFVLALVALVGTLLSCLLLGAGLEFYKAAVAAVVVFVASMACLISSAVWYIAEVTGSLDAAHAEARELRLVELKHSQVS